MTGRTMTNPSFNEIARLWARLGPKRQSVCAWDVEAGQRQEELVRALSVCHCFSGSDEDGEIYLLAWIRPLSSGSATGMVHFANAGTRDQAFVCWPCFEEFARHQGFALLLAFLPYCFRHARAFARDCGFKRCCVMPKSAWLADRGRLVDAELLAMEIE